MSDTPIFIGSNRQLLLDRRLIADLQDARQVLHQPVRRNAAVRIDHPWEEGGLAYAVLCKDGDRFRAWYRCIPHADNNKTDRACTAYAESSDGITWHKPELGLIDFQGSTANNLVIDDPDLVNFSPFLDPAAPKHERYKGIGRRGAIYTATSPDGLHWRKNPTPVQTEGPFDSHNIAFRDPWTGQYVMYTRGIRRDGELGHGATRAFKDGVRWVRRATSDDFVHWSPLAAISTGAAPLEHLYTNSCVPYERSPGLYLMFPSRFVNSRSPTPGWPYPGVNDAVLLSSHDGLHFDRLFPEALVRPGPDPGNWHDRSVYIMRGLLHTGPSELSLYMTEHWRMPTSCIRRLTMRLDGFASVQAPYRGGQFTTKPLIFSGDQLRLNMSTSAAGSIRVELQDENGQPFPGLSLADSPELFQDQTDLAVPWESGAAIGSLAGRPVRLRFAMHDADLYALRFCRSDEQET